MSARIFTLLPMLFALWGAVTAWGATETLRIPIVLDYPFIRAIVVDQVFTGAGEKAVALKDERGCNQIELWKPDISSQGSYLKLGSYIRAFSELSQPDKCAKKVAWEGYVEVLQRVHFDPNTSILRFETVDSHLYDRNRKRSGAASGLWAFLKVGVHALLDDRMSIDLSGPLTSLKDILPTVFTSAARDRVEGMLKSIRVDQVGVGKNAIEISLSMAFEPFTVPPEPSPKLSAKQVERLIQIWESWDAYSIYQVESLFDKPLTPNERRTIRNTLVENRQAFVNIMADKTADKGFIEAQFRKSWAHLVPIFKKYLRRKSSLSPLTLVSFFTTSEALSALSNLGSRLGLELSREGLLRLAGLINPEGVDRALNYNYTLSPKLRRFLGFGSPLDESGPAYEGDELDLPENGASDKPSEAISVSWLFRGASPAFAEESRARNIEEIQAWLPPQNDPGAYLDRVKQLLKETAENFRQKVDNRQRSLFVPLVLATAWQETCWRQFVVTNGKLTYLRSYNGTSVGLMQINERVWRGIYRMESLRWNIRYNAQAGSEILGLYLQERGNSDAKNSRSLDRETLACGVYAMYNSGPGGFSPFLKRKREGSLYESETLFKEKFGWAWHNQFDKISLCY
jgi:hypothetical protein